MIFIRPQRILGIKKARLVGWVESVAVRTRGPEGVGDRLEVCDTDSLIKESKYSTADWSG